MVTPTEALSLMIETIPLFHREDCPISAAHGRVLRGDLKADRDLPPYDRVTMDGFALRSSALASGIREFVVVGTQGAGMMALELPPAPGTCVEVMTGAVLPVGADCVVPYEQAERKGTIALISESGAGAVSGSSVHRKGSDHPAGSLIVRAGTRLTGREIAVAAACGHATLRVSRVPKVAILTTGDELVEVDSPVASHQIRRSNDHALRAALIAAGYPQVERFHVRDMRHEIEHLLWHLLAEYDVLLVTGGVSKGKFDYLPEELNRQRVQRVFQGVAQRPGKPFWFGMSSRMTPVFALPGNPVSAYTCLHRFVLPALSHALGETPRPLGTAVLGRSFSFAPKLACMLPVQVSFGPHAERVAFPHAGNTSGDLAGLVGTDGFLELPAGVHEFAQGTVATFWPWV